MYRCGDDQKVSAKVASLEGQVNLLWFGACIAVSRLVLKIRGHMVE